MKIRLDLGFSVLVQLIKPVPWGDLSRLLRNPQDVVDFDNYGFLHTNLDEIFDSGKHPSETRHKTEGNWLTA